MLCGLDLGEDEDRTDVLEGNSSLIGQAQRDFHKVPHVTTDLVSLRLLLIGVEELEGDGEGLDGPEAVFGEEGLGAAFALEAGDFPMQFGLFLEGESGAGLT
jgi:hypothetical protein